MSELHDEAKRHYLTVMEKWKLTDLDDSLKETNKVLALSFTTMTEAMLLSALLKGGQQDTIRKQMAAMDSESNLLDGIPIRENIHPTLLAEAGECLLERAA